jgi:putative ABC transport system ATP-binding protein
LRERDRPDDGAPLFSLRGVCKDRGGRPVLRDVTLDIPGGQVVAVIGPSGAGKSSLIRLLNRLDDPTSGSVRFRGRSTAELEVRALRRRVGFVFQAATMFGGTVADNLRAAANLEEPRRALDAAALARLLGWVELDESYLSRTASALSGGEQQRVSIARALVSEPEALLLDEPTSALDPEVAERLMHTVARLSAERGLSIVMVTHRLAEARAFSRTTVMLESGRVVEMGESAALFAAAREQRTREFVRSAG